MKKKMSSWILLVRDRAGAGSGMGCLNMRIPTTVVVVVVVLVEEEKIHCRKTMVQSFLHCTGRRTR